MEDLLKIVAVIKGSVGLGTYKRTPAWVIDKAMVLETQEKYPNMPEAEIRKYLRWIREKLNE
jgi:hypothetical protein